MRNINFYKQVPTNITIFELGIIEIYSKHCLLLQILKIILHHLYAVLYIWFLTFTVYSVQTIFLSILINIMLNLKLRNPTAI